MRKLIEFQILQGTFPTKSPKQRFENPDSAFVHMVSSGDEECEKIEKAFGIKKIDTDLAVGWLAVKGFIGAHTDWGAGTFVHLSKGRGVLGILYKGKLQEHTISKGDSFLFDNRKTHFWACQTPCQMFLMSAKKI